MKINAQFFQFLKGKLFKLDFKTILKTLENFPKIPILFLLLENMQKGAPGSQISNTTTTTGEPRPLDTVEMFVSVFCFIKDSALVSQTLLDDFRTCQASQQIILLYKVAELKPLFLVAGAGVFGAFFAEVTKVRIT